MESSTEKLLYEEEFSRQRFFIVCLAVAIPTMAFFGLKDIFNAAFSEGWLDVVSSLILIVLLTLFLKIRSRWFYRIGILLLILTIFYDLSANIDGDFTWFWFYSIPVAIYYLLGKHEGLFWSVLALITLLAVMLMVHSTYYHAYSLENKIRFLVSWSLVSGIAFALESARSKYFHKMLLEHKNLQQEKARLQEAIDNIKVLKGLLPICARCKKVRDDRGYWGKIETYVQEHSEIDFNHSICPECAKELYPEMEDITLKNHSKQ